jgi:hypothetical protein
MMKKGIMMKTDNKGLTAKINLWPLENAGPDFNAEAARLWMKGEITNAAPPHESFKFNDAGELITILGKWNRQKLKEFKAARKIISD